MLKGMSRLLTSSDVIPVVVIVLVGGGLGALLLASLSPGLPRISGAFIVGLVIFGMVGLKGMGVMRRYRKLSSGKCPHPLCHGVVQESELIAKDQVVCPTCKNRWPKLDQMRFRATSRA